MRGYDACIELEPIAGVDPVIEWVANHEFLTERPGQRELDGPPDVMPVHDIVVGARVDDGAAVAEL